MQIVRAESDERRSSLEAWTRRRQFGERSEKNWRRRESNLQDGFLKLLMACGFWQ
jgi:hypothetical protein